MSRVHYTNENIRKAMAQLDNLEQAIGFNMRCAFPGDYRPDDDYHQGAMHALVQILEHFPKVRSSLDAVEAEVLKCFLEAQEVERKYRADQEAEAKAKGFQSSAAMAEHEWNGLIASHSRADGEAGG